jgi:hypothetical protein
MTILLFSVVLIHIIYLRTFIVHVLFLYKLRNSFVVLRKVFFQGKDCDRLKQGWIVISRLMVVADGGSIIQYIA